MGARARDRRSLAQCLAGESRASRQTARRVAPKLVELWPQLLEQAGNPDGWTLFAEALRQLNREQDAALADGFGAALTSGEGDGPAASVQAEGVDAPDAYRFPPVPEGLLAVTETSMPRLKVAMDDALVGLVPSRGVHVDLRAHVPS